MSSSESGPQGQFFLCSLLPGGLDVLGVINVNGTSVSAAVEGDNSTPLASPSSLFSVDDEDDLFGDKEFEALQAAHGVAPSASSPAPVLLPASSVDDEDDLFGDKEFEAAQPAKTSLDDVVSSGPGSPCSLFNADIDDEDLFGDKEYEAAHAASEGPAKDNNNVLSEEEFEDLLSREYDAFRAAQASETGSSDTPPASGDAESENKNILSDQEFEDLLSREYDAFRAAQASEAGSSPATPAAPHNEANNKSFLSDQEFEDLLSREFDAFQAAAAARSASESSISVVDNLSSNKTSSEKTTTPVSYPYVGGLTMPLAPAAAPTVPGPSPTKTNVPSRARKANRPVPSAPAKLAGDSKDKEWVDPPDSLAARLRVQAQEKKKPRKKQQPARTAAEQSLIAPEPEDEDPRSLMAPEPAAQRDKKGQKRKRQAKTLAPAAQALKDRVETQLANATVAFRLRKLKRPWEHWKEGRKGPATASASEAAPRELVSLQGVVTSTARSTPSASRDTSRSATTSATSSARSSATPSATPSASASSSTMTSPGGGNGAPVGDGAGNNAPTRSGSVGLQEAGEERESKRQATLAKMKEKGSKFVFLDDEMDE